MRSLFNKLKPTISLILSIPLIFFSIESNNIQATLGWLCSGLWALAYLLLYIEKEKLEKIKMK